MRTVGVGVLLLWSVALTGCGDDEGFPPADARGPDSTIADARSADGAGTDAPPFDAVPLDASPPDGPLPDAGVDPVVERGRYLVDGVSGCGDCHTPRLPSGAPDPTRYLAGVDCLFDVDPGTPGFGCLAASNLTNHVTGLASWTASEVKDMFLDGIGIAGEFLHPFMPYWIYHNMTAADADAIVAYLRTIPGIDHAVPASEPPFNVVPAAAVPVDLADVPLPDPGFADVPSATRGRYIAAALGACLDCHTAELPPGSPTPIDMTHPFEGGRAFPAALIGLPVPPFPDVIYTTNLTPHPATGLGTWTPAQIVAALKTGVDKDGGGICPPMPAGPFGLFGLMTDDDALDVANYFLSIAPVESAQPNQCVMP